MTAFAARHPALFHVTWSGAVESIRQNGVLSATRLCARHNHDDPTTLTANRRHPVAIGPHLLRRQGMSDNALRPRLDPAIPVEAWRAFINRLVFLFPTEAAARRLAASEAAEQSILRFHTHDLLQACTLRVCRFNNGYIDRRKRTDPRLRHFSNYVPSTDWTGTPIAEIVVQDSIPPGIPFTVLPSS